MEWLDSIKEPAIKRTMLRDEVKDYLLEAILNGNLKPEERIVETKVAKHLKVSQAPVREALRDLEHMGVLYSEPYKGTFVKKLSVAELQERYIVRAALEETAVRLAVPKLTQKNIGEMQKCIEEMIQAAEAGDLRTMIAVDVQFHRTVIKSSGNHFLLSVWEKINPGSWTLFSTHNAKKDLPDLARRHYEVLDALLSGDPLHAGTIIRQHIEELAPKP
ncbi:GntR family transcriptional regulator [Peribacillus sp. SCS-155]|uniref:GntR family transcriptional regulator n=1 Tax=Peribacillus sedimenti TaxID=3115297 RepID=UPI0039057A91